MEERFGKYRLLVELGRGGMAVVYLAVPEASPDDEPPPIPASNKNVVIKRLHPHLAEDPEFVTMFMDEARLAGRLQHPNVVEAYEVGQVGENYFIAMEFLDGQALRRIQTRAEKAKVAIPELGYAIVVDVLSGLHHAHNLIDDDGTNLSVVHRDVTPHNVFVTYDGKIKVVDFGIAKAERRAQETRQGIVKGKVRYMAPEQSTGETLDRRVDIFASGVLLWELAAGRRLWADVADLDVVQRLVRNEIPRHPREVNPNVPEAIDAICARALAYEPKDRYASALEMRKALEAAVGDAALRKARSELGPTITKLFEEDRAKLKAILAKQLARTSQAQIPTRPPPEVEVPVSEDAAPVEMDVPAGALEQTDPDDRDTTLLRDDTDDTKETDVLPTKVLTPKFAPRPAAQPAREPASVRSVARDPSSISMPVVTATSAPASTSTSGVTNSSPELPPWKAGSKRVVLAGIAVVALLAIFIALVASLRPTDPSPTNTSDLSSGRSGTTKVTLSASPPDAVFSIDDGPPLANPYDGKVTRDDRLHTIRIEAPGHASETRSVLFNADVVVSVNLARATGAPPSATGSGLPSIPPRPTTHLWAPRPPTKPTVTKSAGPVPNQTTSGRPRVDTGDPWK